jgi:hypothetical protein
MTRLGPDQVESFLQRKSAWGDSAAIIRNLRSMHTTNDLI